MIYDIPFMWSRYKHNGSIHNSPLNMLIMLFVDNQRMIGIKFGGLSYCNRLNLQWIEIQLMRP